MAQKKQTQAEKAAAAKKTKTNGAAKPKKYAIQKNTNKQAPTETLQIPARLITSSICAVCFFLFLFAFLNPEAVFLGFILKLVTALIGQIAFYVSIPALLYLFVIHAFSGNVRHCALNAKVPISVTKGSPSRIISTKYGAKTNPATATAIRKTSDVFTQNQKDSFTLLYILAP